MIGREKQLEIAVTFLTQIAKLDSDRQHLALSFANSALAEIEQLNAEETETSYKTETKHRPYENYSDFYLEEIQKIITSKICTNADNEVADLAHQSFFATVHEMLDEELEEQRKEKE